MRVAVLLPCLAALLAACGPDREAGVVRQYAVNLRANYSSIVDLSVALQDSVDSFVATPSPQTHAEVKQAWLLAREAYGASEVGRFYGGPIDAPEGRINAWPIDENFIDYSFNNPQAGIINRPADVPRINAQVLALYNGRAGEENRALGWHAIEFLLWGQRTSQTTGPGERAYSDYLTAPNADRRRTYLQTAAQLLVADLSQVAAEWDLDNAESYGAKFVVAAPKESLTKMMRGFANMAISELLFERMSDPYVTKDQKDEESCFSENTYVDLVANAHSVEDVYLGRFKDQSGPSISDLVRAKNQALDERMRQQLEAATAATEAIPAPFDHSVLSPEGSVPRGKVKAAIDAWTLIHDTTIEVAKTLDVVINLY